MCVHLCQSVDSPCRVAPYMNERRTPKATIVFTAKRSIPVFTSDTLPERGPHTGDTARCMSLLRSCRSRVLYARPFPYREEDERSDMAKMLADEKTVFMFVAQRIRTAVRPVPRETRQNRVVARPIVGECMI